MDDIERKPSRFLKASKVWSTQSDLSAEQLALAVLPFEQSIFLEGPAGAGKTTAAVARLLRLLAEGVTAHSILVLVPQRTLAAPYSTALRLPAAPAGAEVTLLTVGGLAQRMVELFWPLIAEAAGFSRPDRSPTFLTLETSQYYMARLVGPLLERGYFESLVIGRSRLYSQILDNLNKAAVVGFPHDDLGARLKAAWVGESSQLRVYDEAQECAHLFRQYCLAHNLLDFSLQYEVFTRHLWPLPACRGFLTGRYTHLIADNIEEDTPVAHDLIAEWLPGCRSALLIHDHDGGNRRFLGADPRSAGRLRALCSTQMAFTGSFVASEQVKALEAQLAGALRGVPQPGPAASVRSQPRAGQDARQSTPGLSALEVVSSRYYPEMLDWAAGAIAELIHERGVPPGEIVVLAPYLGGALRFSLGNRLEAHGVAVRSHRPSRMLREEPATGCLLTLTALCHPDWRLHPKPADVAHALMLAIEGMDLVRAQLITQVAYRTSDGTPALGSFSEIEPAMQERITFLLGGRYEGLRDWLRASTAVAADSAPTKRRGHAAQEELDFFLGRLFGELLSQPGYGFHRNPRAPDALAPCGAQGCGLKGNYDAGEVAANVIESARKFRQVMSQEADDARSLAREYVTMVREGVVAAQYMRSWDRQPENAVLLAPAYTFLMGNRPVDHQYWLDAGSTGWWERLNQPLTHPYVLSRNWPEATAWTDENETAARQDAMSCLVLGLLRRCRRQVHIGLSEIGEQGNEQRGPLMQAIQRALRG